MYGIVMDNLRRIDLNLLVTLEALLTERNVTRAARRLHLSQPSVSVQLGKLRQIFADPLLAPAPGGMTPTTRAQALLKPLRAALADMSLMLEPRPAFDPATAEITWQVAGADYAEYAVLMPVLGLLRKAAPGVRIAFREAGHSRMFKQLESGVIDLGLLAMEAVPQGLHHQRLFKEHYVLAARKAPPGSQGQNHSRHAVSARLRRGITRRRRVQGCDRRLARKQGTKAPSRAFRAAFSFRSRGRGADRPGRDASFAPRERSFRSHSGHHATAVQFRRTRWR